MTFETQIRKTKKEKKKRHKLKHNEVNYKNSLQIILRFRYSCRYFVDNVKNKSFLMYKY